MIDMTYLAQASACFGEIEEARSRARFDDVDAHRDKILGFIELLERERNEQARRLIWQNECLTDLEIRLAGLNTEAEQE